MMNEIKNRHIKQKAHLEILQSALKTLDAKDRAYAHTDGRIREVEAELSWLENLEMEVMRNDERNRSDRKNSAWARNEAGRWKSQGWLTGGF